MKWMKRLALAMVVLFALSACEERYQGAHTTLTRADLPYTGTIAPPSSNGGPMAMWNNSEFLWIDGVHPTGSYLLTLWPTAHDLDFYVYTDDTYLFEACSSHEIGTDADFCDVVSPPDGVIYAEVYDYDGLGDSYTLAFRVLHEGTPTNPLVVDLTTANAGFRTGADKDNRSYYQITGVTPGANYTVLIDQPDFQMSYQVYTDAFVTASAQSGTQASGATTTFTATAASDGNLYLEIFETFLVISSSSFTLSVN